MLITQHGKNNRVTIKVTKASCSFEVKQNGSGNRVEIDHSKNRVGQIVRFLKPIGSALATLTGTVWRLIVFDRAIERIVEAIGVAMSAVG